MCANCLLAAISQLRHGTVSVRLSFTLQVVFHFLQFAHRSLDARITQWQALIGQVVQVAHANEHGLRVSEVAVMSQYSLEGIRAGVQETAFRLSNLEERADEAAAAAAAAARSAAPVGRQTRSRKKKAAAAVEPDDESVRHEESEVE
jgi:hypothetical protein